MNTVSLSIDGQPVTVAAGTTILEAAGSLDIYIPVLCHHPDLPPAQGGQSAPVVFHGEREIENAMPEEPGRGCGLCVVEVKGEEKLVGACATEVAEAMVIITHSDRIKAARQEKLMPIMVRHRHACLTCAQQEGCSRSQCSANVPENERCCPQFGHCELQNVANYVGILDATPRWVPTDFTRLKEYPLFEWDYDLCVGCTRCVRACCDLRGIEAIGFVYDENGRIQIGSLAETLEASGCKFCTACVEVCPTGALADKGVQPATREDDLVPCIAACPAHIDVPGYLRMIARGKADEANAIIREKVPFPGVLGRICIHPCEQVCRQGEINEPISICALKRFAADGEKGLWKNESKVAPDTGKKVAVIGAGPAGLTAAFYLRKQGHSVSLFDAGSEAGGMLRYGIPRYRLPADVLESEIKEILDLGINFKVNQSLGKDISLDQLKNNGFDAVFLGVGAPQSRRISLKGCDTPDVIGGVEFLRQVAEGRQIKLQNNVVVIGGGNLAVDVALTALRCGTVDVKMVCLEDLDEMPAGAWEIERAKAEGVQILPCWGPDKIISDNGKVTGLDIVACTAVFDEQGNFSPEFSDKKECMMVDQVILAVGRAADLSFLDKKSPIKINRGLVVVDEDTLETGMPGVYAGGDIATVHGAVIHAVAAGRRAAASIDRALGGCGNIDEVLFPRDNPDPFLGRDEGFASFLRENVPELDVEIRIRGFQEIVTGYSDESAVKEAERCLQCDLRSYIRRNPSPPARWLPFDEEHIRQLPETEGVFQLLDGNYQILAIKGIVNLRQELLEVLADNDSASFFEFEENKMFSQRESELIQKYLQEHGRIPGGVDDLDDLF